MTEKEQKIIKQINQISHEEMARLWRFTPHDHPYWDKSKPFFKVFRERFKKLGGFTPAISKAVGFNS